MSLRPMRPQDAEQVLDVMIDAFADLDERQGRPAEREVADRRPGLRRITHLQATDPGGAWVTEDEGGAVDGAALGIVREGLFGLSLLVVRPGRQSGGRGSALLRAALGHGEAARGGIILASEDERALRAYWKAGHRLLPAFDARGPLRFRPRRPVKVREGRWPEDRELVDRAGRAVRGAAHGEDVAVSLAGGSVLLVHPDGGFALRHEGHVRLVAAEREAMARELLRAALHDVPDGAMARVDFIDARQDWAVDIVLEAGMTLVPGGAVAVRGDVGPLRPYLPSGAYL